MPKPKPDVTDNIHDPEEEEKDFGFQRKHERAPVLDASKMTLKEQQRQEYEEARLMDMRKLEELKEKELKEKEEERRKEQEQEEFNLKIAESKSKLSDEPAADNPDAATIQIRLADGSKSVTRRFLKTALIEELYLYIRSLGEDAGLEEATSEFELFQQSKKYDDLTKTIDEEKLFPRAKIYCREL